MHRHFSLAALMLALCILPAMAQEAAKDQARECLRINDSPSALGSGDEQERNRKRWIDACEKALAAHPAEQRIKGALARAYASDGRRSDELRLLRQLAQEGDADASFEIYDTYKSYYRSVSREPQLVGRAEAEKALRRAAELGHPYAMWMLAVLLDRGSTVKRDALGAIHWAEKAMAKPPENTAAADIETRLGHFLTKSPHEADRERGLRILERYSGARGRGDARAYLALALRRQDPVRARGLLEAALKDAPGHAIPPLSQMLIEGEGGPQDVKRALSLLTGRRASDVGAVKGALGRLMIEGRLVPKNVPEGIQLLRQEAVWSLDAQIEMMKHLAANPSVTLSRPENFLYDALEAAELGEPGMLSALVDLKLSDHVQFKDREGACKLVAEHAQRGNAEAQFKMALCRA